MFMRRAAEYVSCARVPMLGRSKMRFHLHSTAQRQLHLQAAALSQRGAGIACTRAGPWGIMRIRFGPCMRACSTGSRGANGGSRGKAAPSSGDEQNKHVAYQMAGIAVLVFGLAYASVPLYKVFCQVRKSLWLSRGTSPPLQARGTCV